MIVDLHKYLIIGSRSEMDHFFTLAQRAGFMEFIGMSHKNKLELPEEAKSLISAIKIARQHTTDSHEPYVPELDPLSLAEYIVGISVDYEKFLEERRLLKAEIARISAFGHFSREEIDKIEKEGNRVIQFFCMKSDLAHQITLPPEVIYVNSEYDLDYFVAINKEKTQYPKMIEIIINQPVGKLRERLHELQSEISLAERQIHDSAKALPHLQNGLALVLNEHYLKLAKHDAASPLGESLFAIEAWVPKTKVKALSGLITSVNVYIEEVAIEQKDKVPTYLENKGAGKMGEDLIQIYDMPSSTDKDPSLWILIFFSLFFAMIISDAGYGMIYFLLGLFLKWKFPKVAGFGKRLIKLTMVLGVSCVIWGTVTASFFGIQIGPNNSFRKASFIHYLASKKAEYHMEKKDDVFEEYVKLNSNVARATDGHDFLVKASRTVGGKVKYEALNEFYDNILLEFSLFVGMIHISLSFIRYMRRNWEGIGWIIFMFGAYLYFPSFLNATSFVNFLGLLSKSFAHALGKPTLFSGIGLVFIIALLQKKKWGALHEVTNAIQVFADVLSYIRLYALALAGMVMAETFNDMGVNKLGLIGGGAFVLVIGHLINMTLSVQGGVIHGLRLNFLEWYHYSFTGGGRLFDPLRLRKTK